MLNFYLNDHTNNIPFIHKRIFQRLADIFHQNSVDHLKSEGSKMRSHGTFKKERKERLGLKNIYRKWRNTQLGHK